MAVVFGGNCVVLIIYSCLVVAMSSSPSTTPSTNVEDWIVETLKPSIIPMFLNFSGSSSATKRESTSPRNPADVLSLEHQLENIGQHDLSDIWSLPVPPVNTSSLTLGYLVEYQARGHIASRDLKIVSGGLAYAVHRINQAGLLHNYNLTFVIRDTHMQTNDSLMAMSKLWRDGVAGFIASATSCQNEAMLAGAWNLPILSHICHTEKLLDKTDYPTFVRTYPPAEDILTSVVSLLKHFQWDKFSIIYGKADNKHYQTLAGRLQTLATEHGLTINHFRHYSEPFLGRATEAVFNKIIRDTYMDTRIYLMLGSMNAVVDFTMTLNSLGLVDSGEYQVVYLEAVDSTGMGANKYLKRILIRRIGPVHTSSRVVDWAAIRITSSIVLHIHETFHYHNLPEPPNLRGARSLLVVKSSPHEGLEGFHDLVRLYNTKPPFNFLSPWTKRIPVQASYLYDAVMIYANALRKVLDEGGSYLDGRAIMENILGQTFTSIQGHLTKIDQDGNAEGNYTVLALQNHVINGTILTSMLPVANFLLSETGQLPKLHMYEGVKINWVQGGPPQAEPDCGYRGLKCVQAVSHLKEIMLGVLGGFAFIAVIISFLFYRNWRYEQEIEGLLWKIARSDIQYAEMTAGSWSKRIFSDASDSSAYCNVSMVSLESRNSRAQMYTCVGKYRGQIVALKTYKLTSSDLTRRDKLQMKMMREMLHKNINMFIGACLEASVLTVVTAYCMKGSLQDVLENDDIKLEHLFLSSLIRDIIQAMMYIHNSELMYHGNLKSSNCVVTSRWTLQVTDMGLLEIRSSSKIKEDHYSYYRSLLWKAPEMLRSRGKITGSPADDVYAFSIILHEMYGRAGPYGDSDLDPEAIVRKVSEDSTDDKGPFRPATTRLTCDEYVKDLMMSCWSEKPDDRPNFQAVWKRFKPLRTGIDKNILDHMLGMMEKYQEHLEDLVSQRTEQLHEEKRKTDSLLYRMLPQSVADDLKRGESVIPEIFSSVTVYFSDICGFTSLSAQSSPMQIVDMLNDLYTCFDSIIKNFDVYKVETIGDAYMVVSGLPIRNCDSHAAEIASMALTLLTAIKSFKVRHRPDQVLKLRTGIHSGPCAAGVVGLTMPRYTLFGDTINTASRIESNGEALKIHCSSQTKQLLDKTGGFLLQERGFVTMKGKGSQLTYWLLGEDNSRCSHFPGKQISQPTHDCQGSIHDLPLSDRNIPQQQHCCTCSHIPNHHQFLANHRLANFINGHKCRDKSISYPDVITGGQRTSLPFALKDRSVMPHKRSLTDLSRKSFIPRSRQLRSMYSHIDQNTTSTELSVLLMPYTTTASPGVSRHEL